jgi:hypothetical protein
MSDSTTTPLGDAEEHPDYAFAVALGSYFLAHEVARVQGNAKRQTAMQRVAERKRQALKDAWPRRTAGITSPRTAAERIQKLKLDRIERRTMLIDLAFSDPFAPYEFRDYDQATDMRRALLALAPYLGWSEADIRNVGDTRKRAAKAHKRRKPLVTAAFGLGGAIIFAVGGWLAAPAIAAYLGAGAGLAGAAATAHGLALLGGGTLAAGGFGMAGGMMVVTGAGAALGGLAGGAGRLLFQMGAAGAQEELVKLQVTFKTVLLETQGDLKKAQEVIKALDKRRAELEALLREERQLNDENAKRLDELEKIINSVTTARKWMSAEMAA